MTKTEWILANNWNFARTPFSTTEGQLEKCIDKKKKKRAHVEFSNKQYNQKIHEILTKIE